MASKAKKRAIIVGAGGCAREVYDWYQETSLHDQIPLKGFLSNNPNDLDSFNVSLPILGDPLDYTPQEGDCFIMGVGDVRMKIKMGEALIKKGGEFLTIIHATALVSPSATLGKGVIVGPYSVIGSHATIGDLVTLNIFTACAHDCKIGHYCTLSPYAAVNGWGILGEGVFMGTHSHVAGKREVANFSTISASTSVLRSVNDPKAFIYNPPAKIGVLPSKES